MSDQPRPDPSPPGDDHPSHPSLAAELSATAHRVEHAVEEKLEHGIEVAEQTIVRRFGLGALRAVRTTLRFAFWSLVAAYFAFGALLLVTRYYVLPRIDQWRPQIEDIAGRALQGTVTLGGSKSAGAPSIRICRSATCRSPDRTAARRSRCREPTPPSRGSAWCRWSRGSSRCAC